MKKFNFTAMIPQVILFSFVFWENPGDHKLLLRFNDGFFSENSMWLKKICQITILNLIIQEERKKYIWKFMNLMLGYDQQLDLSNLQISNIQPKNIVLGSKKRVKIQTSSDEFKIIKRHIFLSL